MRFTQTPDRGRYRAIGWSIDRGMCRRLLHLVASMRRYSYCEGVEVADDGVVDLDRYRWISGSDMDRNLLH